MKETVDRLGSAYEIDYADTLKKLYRPVWACDGDGKVSVLKNDRTGVGTSRMFSPPEIDVDLAEDGFPVLLGKHVSFHIVKEELLWFLAGHTSVHLLQAENVHIWDEWAKEDGTVGPLYGAQWRSWEGAHGCADQIEWLLNEIKTNPASRRLLVSAWNVNDLGKMALPPCHVMFQVFVDVEKNEMSLKWYQRSADWFLGVPYNVASYALLLCLLAKATGYRPGRLIGTFGDAHLYLNHREQAGLYDRRMGEIEEKGPESLGLSQGLLHLDFAQEELFDALVMEKGETVDSSKINLYGYKALPQIKAPVAV